MIVITETAALDAACQRLALAPYITVDTEFMREKTYWPKLCLVQMAGPEEAVIVDAMAPGIDLAPLMRLMADPAVLKIFHFARFDIGILFKTLGVMPAPVYCTKIASRLTRTYTDKHGLKDLVREVLGIDLSKHQQSSDWGADELSEAQVAYAASDVLHLHALKAKLDTMLAREGREALAQACFGFLPDRARLDLLGWSEEDIFAHS